MNISSLEKTANWAWGGLNLRVKLVAILLLVALVPLALIAYLADFNQHNTLTSDANVRLQNAAALVALEIDVFTNGNLDMVRSEGQLPVIVDYLALPADQRPGSPQEDRLDALLLAVSRQDPVYLNSIAILDIKGITLADTNADSIGLNRSNRYYFQNVIQTGLPYASTLEYDTTSKRASLYFAAPIRNRTGTLLGVYRKRFDAGILQAFVSHQNGLAGEGSFAVLLDENYFRMAHGTNRDILYQSVTPLDPDLLANLQQQRLMPPGTAEELSTNILEFKAGLDNFQNTPYFTAELQGSEERNLDRVAVVKTGTQNWYVTFAQPEEVFLAPINAQRQTNILTSLGIALLVAVFGFFISQTISGPISRLTQVAETIAGGDIDIQAQVETGDEIGALAKTFNRMTQQLRDFIANLEERVAARTKDLATVAEISAKTATILESYQMVATAVHLTQRGFGLYHCHVFEYHPDDDQLHIVACGYREGDEHEGTHGTVAIPVAREQSLVARAARTRKPVIVNDVRSDVGWLPNPLLPDTRAELAVPMVVGDELLGVLDVQSERVDAFTAESANIQMTLASQLATALKNAKSYGEAQERATFQSMVNTIGQKIQSAASMEETLQTAVRELGLALGAQRVQAAVSKHEEDSRS